MKIAVVIANRAVIDPLLDVTRIRTLGETWASWHQWHQCYPQHLVCHDIHMAQRLIAGGFHQGCWLYVPENAVRGTETPSGVSVYGGDFLHEVPAQEEIVALHLASASADVVIMIGFDLMPTDSTDPVQQHGDNNRRGLIYEVLKSSDVQWVIADSVVPPVVEKLENVTTDSLKSLLLA